MNKKAPRFLSILVSVILIIVVMAGCGGSANNEENTAAAAATEAVMSDAATEAANLPMLEYTAYSNDSQGAPKWSYNPNDVVTPYVEKKFNIRVKEVIPTSTQSLEERLNLWIASNTLPDVLNAAKFEVDLLISKGVVAPLDDYIKDMPNLNKYFDGRFWNQYKTDGKIYQLPCPRINLNDTQYVDDPYSMGVNAHAMWVREDILAQCGYKFTSMADLQKDFIDAGKKPSADDFKIEPAINTPDDLYNLLKKIKALNLKVNNLPVYPMSQQFYNQFHLGCMLGFGWFEDDGGSVNGYLGLPGAKDWYKFLNKLYNEGLLDKDFMIQKIEQVQDKVASGRVAVGFNILDKVAAEKALTAVNPASRLRPIAWPKMDQDKGYYDVYVPAFNRVVINKNFKEIGRLTKYFDWFLSDEGLDICTWGPESAGLWEMKDGKKVFKDPQVENDILNNVTDSRGADYYGLYMEVKDQTPWWSKAAACSVFLDAGNPKSYKYSYPPKVDLTRVMTNTLGANGMDFNGRASYGSGDNANATVNYFWNDFAPNRCASLFMAKDDAEFEKAWNEVYKEFLEKGKYEAAIEDMKKWFEVNKVQ